MFNNTGSAISAQIAVSNSATINGAAATSNDDIASYKAATFIATGNNTWAKDRLITWDYTGNLE